MGRNDEQIKSQGYRISPGEVELLLDGSGLLAEVVVKGEPDEALGMAVIVHCVPRDPATFDPAVLLEYCREHMPSYMIPRAVRVHASFPRTSSGKIARKDVC